MAGAFVNPGRKSEGWGQVFENVFQELLRSTARKTVLFVVAF